MPHKRDDSVAMSIYESLDLPRPERDVVLSIGSFDGVHLGHQHLLRSLVAQARATGRLSAALTFYPHPRAVLRPDQAPQYLTTQEERNELLLNLGLDLVVVLRFDRAMAATSGEDFVRLLYERLRMRELWVGSDFAMGRGRAFGVPELRALGERLGIALRVVPPYEHGGEPVSSTRIRNVLAAGEVAEARELLGRPVSFRGQVVEGARRGHRLGFPTANLPLDPHRAIPLDGVYVVWAVVDGCRYAAVANLGASPSFDSDTRLLEVHLLDYDGDLYGRMMTVEFVQRLRPVVRFEDLDGLVRQIDSDVRVAREVLSGARAFQP